MGDSENGSGKSIIEIAGLIRIVRIIVSVLAGIGTYILMNSYFGRKGFLLSLAAAIAVCGVGILVADILSTLVRGFGEVVLNTAITREAVQSICNRIGASTKQQSEE